jgi:hypothetical protein
VLEMQKGLSNNPFEKEYIIILVAFYNFIFLGILIKQSQFL